MKIIVCVDDNLGMMFNHRRQSQDAVVRARIMQVLHDKNLWMNAYSVKQFSDTTSENICVDENFMERAAEGDFCFLENVLPSTYEEQIEEIILFKWNRKYPSDFKFDIPLNEHGWMLMNNEEFKGSSHEKITKEVYRR